MCITLDVKSGMLSLHDAVLNRELHITDVEQNEYVNTMLNAVDEELNTLAINSRTAKLWVEYYRQVQIMSLFVRAERCGDWKLHLYAVLQMLPYFHAAGHFIYAKSAHMYLQQMTKKIGKLTSSVTV